jgi:lipopolysaccharide biosynthesis glycosyltransferase
MSFNHMNIVFCADRNVLQGLHVAAYSMLDHINPDSGETHISILSDDLDDVDIKRLHDTLSATKKEFALVSHRIEASRFAEYPRLNGSIATYYRLAAPHILNVDRFLYIDVDTLCDLDVSQLFGLDMRASPAAMVPEAPLSVSADRLVAEVLGNSHDASYFNAGVILVNVEAWRREMITERAMEYLNNHPARFWDQSALNVVLHGKVLPLDERYNTISNMRKNWPMLTGSYGSNKRLIHFLDYPKPWGLGAKFVHPHYNLWRSVSKRTAMRNCRSCDLSFGLRFQKKPKTWIGYKNAIKDRVICYKKAIKDRILFEGYSRGLIKNVKGIS